MQQIFTQTPVYVWAILAFLIVRGVHASKDRSVPFRRAFILPAVMLALGLQSTASGFGLATLAGAAWLGAVVLSAALTWRGASVTVDRAAGTVLQRGSWMPLALMMSIFCCKFVIGVALSVQPALQTDLRFALPACLLLGLFNGVFIGRMLRTVTTWTAASVPGAYVLNA